MNTDLLKTNLQYFAEEDDHEEENQEDKNNEEESQLPTNQSELDALINKANQKAIENAKKDLFTKEDLDKAIQDELKKTKRIRRFI